MGLAATNAFPAPAGLKGLRGTGGGVQGVGGRAGGGERDRAETLHRGTSANRAKRESGNENKGKLNRPRGFPMNQPNSDIQ